MDEDNVFNGSPVKPGEEGLPAELRTYGIMESNGYKHLTGYMGMNGAGGITSEGFD